MTRPPVLKGVRIGSSGRSIAAALHATLDAVGCDVLSSLSQLETVRFAGCQRCVVQARRGDRPQETRTGIMIRGSGLDWFALLSSSLPC